MSCCNPQTPTLFTNFHYGKRRCETACTFGTMEQFQESWTKQVVTAPQKQKEKLQGETFVCGVAGCRSSFSSSHEFDYHYRNVHCNQCITCGGIYASKKLLEIHITEFHDPFFTLLSTKQSMLLCYVADCNQKFMTTEERQNHLIAIHSYPQTYDFSSVIKPRTQPSQRKKTNIQKKRGDKEEDMMVEGDAASDNTPKTLSFGNPTGRAFHSKEKNKGDRGRGRGGRGRGGKQTSDVKQENM
eukprot:TRINITY_DN7100_c0_g1_i1.p1 TRINITY_DN7100_c0_g1~~TRINITY_DN7100_c0_g1_i1.p1  ORF type:complete len:242 (+),score=50.24 TRINITY_DN7100_c0_g1_i1:55-780(+)